VPVNSKEAKNLNALPKLPDPMWPTSGSILDAAPTPNGVGFDIRQTSAGATAPEAATLIDHITFPTTSKIWDNMANPQGTRRAFMMSDSQVPGYAALIHRLIPSYTYPAHPIERICIYRADSRELYEVGRVKETSNSNPDLINVGWLPDGKQIQFMYKNAVYVVDVD
jgi:hypothetical protein